MNKTATLLAAIGLTAPLAVRAQAPDLPARKPGLWEMTTATEQPKSVPPVTVKMCVDPESDRELMDYGLHLSGGKCKSMTTKREGKSFIVDADCTIAGRPTKSRTVLTGDFHSAYTVRIEGTIGRGEGKSPKTTAATQTLTWKGADCPGMKPGDISVFGGVKLNIKQIKAFSGLIR